MRLLESFKLFGPNRRCEQTAIEVWLKLAPEEATLMLTRSTEHQSRVLALLAQEGIRIEPGHPLEAPLEGSGAERYAALLGRSTLALQQYAGHRVAFQATFPGSDPEICGLAVEYEHGDAALEAMRLAVLLLEEAIPQILLGGEAERNRQPFADALRAYLQAAPAQRLPRQTQDIIDAAGRRDIPATKLDRDPYQGVSGAFRICPNGMLKLGHGCRQRVIDGTFPVDRGEDLAALAHDRAALRQALESCGAPLIEARLCTTTRQAVRAADDLGYPVRLRSRTINRSRDAAGAAEPLGDRYVLSEAARLLLQISPGLIVEPFTPGREFRAILADRALVAVLELRNGVAVTDVSSAVPSHTRTWLERVAKQFNIPLMTVTWTGADIADSLPPSGGGVGAVIDADVAPILDGMFPANGPVPSDRIRAAAAEGLLRHLFPEGTPARIPIVAVTGTNGKSTVCAMIARVMQHAGYHVGRAGTTGLYLGDELLESGDFSGGRGHHRVLESPEVDFAVLETARGAATGFGLMFDRCDISVCTNVSADHLGERGIDTVEQMAELKGWIVQRARDSAVLNADNDHSAAMLPALAGRKAWLVSTALDSEALRSRFGNSVALCITEATDNGEWIVLHEAGRRTPVVAVGDIPATFGGMVRFNVSNALQATAACYQLGVPVEGIRDSLAVFTNDFKTIPGRLNFYDGLPFRVLFDFAHNEDGHLALRSVVDRLQVEGRKMLVIRRRGNVSDEALFKLAGIVADGYDRFVCCDHPRRMGRKPGEAAALLKAGLVSHGVPESCVTEAAPEEAVQTALGMCRPGDLLVVTTTTESLHRDWHEITQFG